MWSLDPGQAFGSYNFERWTQRLVSVRGYPVRIQWRVKSSDELLAEGVLWGGEEYGGITDHEDVPTLAEALLPQDGFFVGRDYDAPEKESALERALLLALEQPDTLKNALGAVADFFKQLAGPDELAMKAAADYAAERAAFAVENKLADIMRQAGYDVDESGEVTAPEDEVIEVEDDEAGEQVEEFEAERVFYFTGETDLDEEEIDELEPVGVADGN